MVTLEEIERLAELETAFMLLGKYLDAKRKELQKRAATEGVEPAEQEPEK